MATVFVWPGERPQYWSWVGLMILALTIFYGIVVRTIYILYLHPLAKFPGPRSWALTRWFVSLSIIGGKSHDKILALHELYGPIVRVAPDEISVQSIEAWHDIGGHRKQGQLEMGKEPVFNEAFKDNLLGVRDRDNHGRMRRILSRGFSASTMAKQEVMLKRYIDKLMLELRNLSLSGKQPIDIEPWFSFVAFDIIGDLTFGESFGSLESGGHHPWASLIFDTTRFVILANCLKRINRIFLPVLALVTPAGLAKRVRDSDELRDAKIAKRRALGATRPDYMSAMLGDDGKGLFLNDEEIRSNCTALILGGSETISTALSAATYHLAANPECLMKLQEEIRSAFHHEDEIDLTRTGQLKYLQAVITEALRMMPPFAGASPRVVPKGGAVIAGEFVPAGTTVGIWHWSMSHSPRFFVEADRFHPERWLDDAPSKFHNDQRQAAQPFAVGPRNCIGMNLARVELRLILAKLLWNFDMSIDAKSITWADDLIEYFGWEKQPLLLNLAVRDHK